MRVLTATITMNSEILPGVHLLEVQSPQLARAAQPGHYCLLRCCDALAYDPLLRRPFFVADAEAGRDTCRFVVYRRGRASSWLIRQQPGMTLDLLGPLGRPWEIRPQVRNVLLSGADPLLPSLLFLARQAIERELAVTLIHCVERAEEGYPPALLSPEIEYQVFVNPDNSQTPGASLAAQLGAYFSWADAVCCGLPENVLAALVRAHPRLREKYVAQAVVGRPLMCVSGTCLACQLETRHGPRLVCRDGPVFSLRDVAADW
jgi:dihydroorotate dehydrogenase electron transfer subunit